MAQQTVAHLVARVVHPEEVLGGATAGSNQTSEVYSILQLKSTCALKLFIL